MLNLEHLKFPSDPKISPNAVAVLIRSHKTDIFEVCFDLLHRASVRIVAGQDTEAENEMGLRRRRLRCSRAIT
jgi:hypothetical protein